MQSPINNFLKSKISEQENNEFKNVIPDFLFKDDSIIEEIKKIDKSELVEMFGGIFLALNQLGEKLFSHNSELTVNDEFKQKVLSYNPKSEKAFLDINDLIFSDLVSAVEAEYKESGLVPFYNEKFDSRSRKIRQNII